MKFEYLEHKESTYKIRNLSKDDIDDVMKIFSASPGYFMTVEGELASEKSAVELFEEVPPGKGLEEKFVIGVFLDNSLVGVIDLVKDFPENGEWIIGLLLIHPCQRRKGLGLAIHKYLCIKAKQQGAEKLRIGVAEENESALAYWKSVGYYEIYRTDPIKYSNKENVLIVMNYTLDNIEN